MVLQMVIAARLQVEGNRPAVCYVGPSVEHAGAICARRKGHTGYHATGSDPNLGLVCGGFYWRNGRGGH